MLRFPTILGKHCTANGPAETLFMGGAVRDVGRVVSRRVMIDEKQWMYILDGEQGWEQWMSA